MESIHISGTVKARNFKFRTHKTTRGTNEQNARLGPTFKIFCPLHISETAEARNFKYGVVKLM